MLLINFPSQEAIDTRKFIGLDGTAEEFFLQGRRSFAFGGYA